MHHPRILLAVDSLRAGNGGICRVARLMAKVLDAEARAAKITVRAEVFGDTHPPADDFAFPVRCANRNRPAFLRNVHVASLRSTHVLFDCDGMARARGRIYPFARPWACWMHGIEAWENAKRRRPDTIKQANRIWVNSNYTLERATRSWGEFKHAKVCWLATENDSCTPLRGRSDNAARVAIIGRIDKASYKGHYELIEVWADVCRAVPGAELWIVGTGPGAGEVKRMAEKSDAKNQIKCLGFIAEEEMHEVWASISVFAMPSAGEGFGLVYIEAMARGLPIVASTADAASEINVDRFTGRNVEYGNREALRDALVAMLQNPLVAAELGRNGRERWLTAFRYSRFRERWLPLLKDFIGDYS